MDWQKPLQQKIHFEKICLCNAVYSVLPITSINKTTERQNATGGYSAFLLFISMIFYPIED